MNSKKDYNTVFITNIPSFYKLNLYNRIAKHKRILVIFIEDNHGDRNLDFCHGDRNFDWISLSGKSNFNKLCFIVKLLCTTIYEELVISGWDELLYWFSAFISPKSKNAVIVESSYIESVTTGLKSIVKKVFISRVSKAYVSGKSQKTLMDNLGFRGVYRITKGVGVFNIVPKPIFKIKNKVMNFLYIGRLSHEKNLEFLVSTFNKYPHLYLNIIGFGPMEEQLKKIAKENIIFHGAVDNKKLPDFFNVNDVFILPSLREVWGLVVEEALNNGLPVIVSNKVGCVEEIIQNNVNGLVFSLEDSNGIDQAIDRIQNVKLYNNMRCHISEMDFEQIAEGQVKSYLM